MNVQTVATKGNLIATKKSLQLAKTGFELLDKKRNILVREMMTLITRATEIQDKMRNACIKSFNKFYDMDFKLKEKQKGRNQDINVKDMGDYRKIKKQLAKKEQKLEKANT